MLRTIRLILPAMLLTVLSAITFSASLHAGDVDVVDVQIKDQGENRFRIDVTLKHDDQGWDHYANRWDVLSESGEVLGSRVLAHPHVNEQPFTRSLSVTLPVEVKIITLRGNDSVHGLAGITMSVSVPGR